MYVPPHFAENRLALLHATMERVGIASLATNGEDGPFVSHIPLTLDRTRGSLGTLIGHVSRANPQWKDGDEQPAVAIFFGPNGYISPGWYAAKREHGKVVPTWDYITVHARGTLRAFSEPERLHAVVEELTDHYEQSSAHPWHVDDAPEPYVASQLKGIVGLELPIETLVGKWKLSQNRSEADIDGVIDALRALGDEGSIELAREVAEARPNL